MSIQIKKKFIKSQVIDGTKVLFLNEDSFKAMKSNGDIAELFKFSNGDKLVMLQMPQVSSDPVAAEDLARKGYVDSQVSSEASARAAAVSAEEARALAAEAGLQSEIDSEEAARIAGDSSLQSEIDAEETRALAAEAGLQSAIDAEQAARIAAVSAEATARAAADLTFLKLDGSRSMEGDLNMEKTSAGAGAGVVSSYSVYQKPGAAPVVWHVDVVLNDPTGIFQYGGDFWQGPNDGLPPDGTLPPSGSLSYGIPYTSGSGVAIYWAVPKQADGVTSNFAAAVKIGTIDYSKTDSSAFTPEGGLSGSTKYKIIGIADGVAANDAVNKSQLDFEASARVAGDASLQSEIDAEEARALAAEAGLQSAIDALDSGVSGDLATEIARATAAEAALQSAIDAEEARALAAEAGLQSSINTEKGRIDAILLASEADKDSFAEIVQLINSVDTENDSAFASYVLSNNAALAQEVADRQAGDSAEAAIRAAADTAEQTARIAGDDALDARLDVLEGADTVVGSVAKALKDAKAYTDVEQAAREAAVSAEEAARVAGDNALDARLDILETDPTTKSYVDNKVLEINTDITDLDGYAQDIRSDLDQEILDRAADVDAEEARALAAEAVLSASITAEASTRAAADSDEQAARIAGDAAEASARTAAISTEAAARAAQDLVLDGKIDTKFQQSKDYTDQKVADLVASAPAVLDTLKELADALGGDANFATTVASQIASAANDLGDRFMYEQFVVDAGMISAGYMELAYKGFAASMVVSNGRLMMFESEDYSVSVVGGKSRLTFMGSMLPGEAEALEVGDVVKVKYLKDIR